MVSKSPSFWWQKADWRAWAFYLPSRVYGALAGWRMSRNRPMPVPVPVICVGNFTIGGAGKTPTVIALAQAAKARGLNPGILSRGYGGSLDRATIVDPDHHRARDVGDEPLVLARHAMTAVCRKRVEGARQLIAKGADIIVMDDGFQSARIAIDYALLVIDSNRGIGNGFMVPAGPVRAPVAVQLVHATALLKVGDGNKADPLVRRAARAGKPVYAADIVPVGVENLGAARVLAFAGIANPDKFFRTVTDLGMEIVDRRSFGDHHHFSDDELADILNTAIAQGLQVVTTAKDHVRLAGYPGLAEDLAARAHVINVEMVFDAPSTPAWIINQAVELARKRKLTERDIS